MQALADELWLASGRVRTLAKTIAAAQQQGQAVAWVRYRSDGGIEGPVLDQHMDDIRRNSGAWTPLGRITAPPPSAPVGVEQRARELLKAHAISGESRTFLPDTLVVVKDGALRAIAAALAQQPAAVDEAMVMVPKRDALILANFAIFAKAHGGAMEQLAARRIASLATQHQEPRT